MIHLYITADTVGDDRPLGGNLPQIWSPLTSSVSNASSMSSQTGIFLSQKIYFQVQFCTGRSKFGSDKNFLRKSCELSKNFEESVRSWPAQIASHTQIVQSGKYLGKIQPPYLPVKMDQLFTIKIEENVLETKTLKYIIPSSNDQLKS